MKCPVSISFLALFILSSIFGRMIYLQRPAEAAAVMATATPASIAVSQPTAVTVTIQLSDPQVLPQSINLQRVDANGEVLVVLGAFNDQGTNGDTTPGDQVFTINQTFTEATATPILLRVSWAVRGSLGRAVSNTLRIEVR